MPEPLAYFNGRFLPASQACVPVFDAGFVQGVTVSEQMRTFQGRLFRLPQHLERLAHSLEIVGVRPPVSMASLAEIAQQLASHNHGLLSEGDDLGLSLLVTPGTYPAFADGRLSEPTVGLHTYRLPFHLWVEKYTRGQALAVTSIEQVPPACWPPELKCRSRMHYYLADREAHLAQPGARALLLDADGEVVESSTANVVLYCQDTGLVSPPREKILPGISMAVVMELAEKLQIPFSHRRLTVEDVYRADEVLLTSTSPCLLPVVRLNDRQIGQGHPGPVFQQLLAAWSRLVEVDIQQQAARFARRQPGVDL